MAQAVEPPSNQTSFSTEYAQSGSAASAGSSIFTDATSTVDSANSSEQIGTQSIDVGTAGSEFIGAESTGAESADTEPATHTAATVKAPQPPTIGLFGSSGTNFAQQYHVTRAGKVRRIREIFSIARKFDIFHGLTPVKMRLMLEAMGPTFVKVGQNLSLRSEILPQEFCDELSKLRAEADPMPYEQVLHVLTQEYGKPVQEIFAEIDRTPLGSASLAQVHRAKLVSGEDVAVKVQRPGVRETMAQDIDIMRSVARYARHVVKSTQIVDLHGVVDELWETFQSETNFLIEAQNLRDFRDFCADYQYMDCPKPYMALCTSHVVVMDYVNGISISHPDQLVEAGYDLEEIGAKLVDNYAAQVLDEGFFHADPHPGNIMVHDGCIMMLDLGMTGKLNARNRSIMRDMIFAVGRQDSPALAEAFLRFAGPSDVSQVDHPGLLADLDAIVQDFATVQLRDLNVGELISALIALARKHNIELPSIITTVGRGLVTLEGVLDEFLPDTDMIDIITAHIASSTGVRGAIHDEAQRLAIESNKALHGSLGALAEAQTAARMLTRGQIKTNIELVGSQEPIRQMSYMVDRLTMAMIVVGLYVGSSIVYFAGIKPVVFGIPIIGFMGYVVAFVVSCWIVLDIMHKNRKPKSKGR